MNILQVQDRLKGLSEQQLAQEMQMPSGMAPQYLVLTELQRRKRVRDDFQAQSAQAPTTTVAQDAVTAAGVPQAGIAPMAQALAPKTDVTQNTGIAALAPQTAPEPQRMADGGIVRKMAEGRAVYTDPAIIAMANRMGMTVENYLKSLGPSGALVQQQAEQRAARNRMMATEPPMSLATPPDMFQSVNPSYKEQTTSVFPDDSVPPPNGLAIPPQPLYNPLPEQPFTNVRPQSDIEGPTPRKGALDDVVPYTAEDLTTSWDSITTPITNWMNKPDETVASVDPYTGESVNVPTVGTQVRNALDWFGGGDSSASTMEEEAKKSAEEAARLRDEAGITESLKTPEEVAAAAKAAKEALRAQNEAVAAEQPTAPVADTSTSSSASFSASSSGPQSDYEKAIADALARADKRANQDKWLAVAQAGMALMSSKQPTLGGALGEAGMLGVGAYRDSRDAAEKTKMDLLNTQFQIDMERQKMALARAEAASRGSGGGGKPMAAAMVKYLADERNAIADQLSALPPIEPAGFFSDEYDPAAAERKRLADALQVAEQSLAYARATYGLPSYLAPDEEEFNAADE